MKLEFASLELYNFKSFNRKHVFDLGSKKPGLHFIRGRNRTNLRLGSNGAGKSTLLDSICWCLYGKTVRGLKNPDIRPWTGKKKTRVSLTVYVDGKEHVITRTAAPNSLKINDEDSGQEQVDDLLRLSFDVFTNTVFMGQDRPLLFDLQPSAKMRLFSEVLNLDKWDGRSKLASDSASKLSVKESSLTYAIGSSRISLEQVDKALINLKKQSDNWESGRKNRADEDRKALEKAKADLIERDKKLVEATMKYDMELTEYNLFKPNIEKAENRLRIAEKKVAKSQLRIQMHKRRINALKTKLENADEKLCPTCGQKIKASQAKSHLQEMRDEIKELSARVKRGVSKKYLKSVSIRSKKITRLNETAKKMLKEASKHEQTMSYWTPQVAETKALIKSLEQQLARSENEENPFSSQIRMSKKAKVRWTTEIEEQEAELNKVTRKLARAKFWVKGFKDVKLYVLDEVLAELQLTTSSILQDVGLEGWQILYDVEKETKAGTTHRGLNVSIISPKNKKPVRWENWSGGEGQRLRLVGALALSEVLLNYAGVEPDMEILDEPTQHLSAEGISDLCDLLANRAKQIDRRIFYIDHQSVDGAQFSSVTTIVNDKKGSHIKGV